MPAKSPREHLVTAKEIAEGPVAVLSHPLDREHSEVELRPLGDRVGLQRAQVRIGRIPPGKEAFIHHRHTSDEEWAYVLSGHGHARIGDERFDVGPGDFMAFPIPSPSHSLAASATEELVYLMGGERGRVEVSEFPTAGKHGFFSQEGIFLVDSQHLQKIGFEDYLKKR
jgi:uncharacterized cupin superfamily protein